MASIPSGLELTSQGLGSEFHLEANYGASPLKGESRDRGVMAEGYLIQGEGVDFLGASTGERQLPQNNSLAVRRHPP